MANRKWPFLSSVALLVVGILAASIYNQYIGASTPTALVQAAKPLDKPPAGQTYIGSKECSSCHFDQFLTWRETKHAQGFHILPAKYQEDKTCLKCHVTGHGEAGGV